MNKWILIFSTENEYQDILNCFDLVLFIKILKTFLNQSEVIILKSNFQLILQYILEIEMIQLTEFMQFSISKNDLLFYECKNVRIIRNEWFEWWNIHLYALYESDIIITYNIYLSIYIQSLKYIFVNAVIHNLSSWSQPHFHINSKS